ncbi:MAG: hypothetical protein CMI54_05755 [Parcubacteria group bacterium]|nr:hypothetical protein [Parcubacteria group bacterium]|tara:strand:- start:732 stop:1172 length:441 start_codon:yes stop_codon:yes gene_type:complete
MGEKHYKDKKKKYRKDGTVDAGKGKIRQHHKAAQKRVKKHGDSKTMKHRRTQAEMEYLPRTPNKYQSQPKKSYEDASSITYEWLEDNGHKDHCQIKRKKVLKDEDRMPLMFGGGSKEYKDNYDKIFGEKDRGASTGKHKRTKKVYK